jgi:hypothetical protein
VPLVDQHALRAGRVNEARVGSLQARGEQVARLGKLEEMNFAAPVPMANDIEHRA